MFLWMGSPTLPCINATIRSSLDSENLRVACHSRHPHNTRLSSAAFELHLLVYGFSRVSQDIGLIVHGFNNKFGAAKMGRHLLSGLHALWKMVRSRH
jgi:hypothetical protein